MKYATLKECYDALALVSRQLHEGLITEPEWLTGMVDILMQRDRTIKIQAATALHGFLLMSLDNPMSSQALQDAIINWQDANYYLIKPDPAGASTTPV